MKLKTLTKRIKPMRTARVEYIQYSNRSTRPGAGGSADKRIQGRALQARRRKLWLRSPYCAMCGRVTEYPGGFELDHIIPLFAGGSDDESNCQVLCNGDDGCHRIKTRQDEKKFKGY